MKYQALPVELFSINRRRFVRHMKPDSVAIFHSNDQMPRNGDQYFPFRQNSALFALSGLDQPETVLVLFPDCVKEGFREVAFIQRASEHSKIWEGHRYTKEEATKISGIQKIFFIDEMPGVLNELILLSKRIYINPNENDRYVSDVPNRDLRFAQKLIAQYPAHKLHRSQPILKKVLMNKNIHEVALIQHAINLTNQAFRRVLEFVRPGVWEYEVEAEIIHEFIRNRATGHAYTPIIASGKNACILHYNENNQQCKPGELLLMDFGAEYANYAADMTRTIPVDGTFTERQKAVYQSVLNVMKRATKMLLPGHTLEEYHKEVGKMMESELLKLGLISRSDIDHQPKDKPAYKKYFMHGTSHHLGLDVHDLGDRYAPIQAGMVFTVEPGIYIPEEGFGIRLEDNILVTDDGPVNLMKDIPVEIKEIEELMHGALV